MTVNVEIPKQAVIEKYIKLGIAGIGLVIILRLAAKIAAKIHEKKQDRRLKKLERQVSELESEVSHLKKAVKP